MKPPKIAWLRTGIAIEPVSPPIRDVLLPVNQLEAYAQSLAKTHTVTKHTRRSHRLLARLEADYRALNASQKIITSWVRDRVPLSRSVEWLLDNAYIIHGQVRDIRKNMPSGFYKELPQLVTTALSGYPRIYGIAYELVSHTDGLLSEEALIGFTNGYQTEVTLSSGELWALPTMMQIGLVQNLQRLTQQIVYGQQRRAMADEWADHLFAEASVDPTRLEAIIAEHDSLLGTLDPVFSVHLLQRFLDQGPQATPFWKWLDERLALQNMSFDDIKQITHSDEAANLTSVSNCITSLRFIAEYDWTDFFERVSRMDAILREDPCGTYIQMDFPTRDRYRHAVEAIAKATHTVEMDVAHCVITLATEAMTRGDIPVKRQHIGFYLIDRGREELNVRLRGRASGVFYHVGRMVDHIAPPLYPVSIILFTGVIVALVLYLAAPTTRASYWWALVLMILPASDLAINVIGWSVMRSVPPCRLPKLELKEGIPQELRSVVVIHTMLIDDRRTQSLVNQMEVYYLANMESHLHFALLSDFPDATEQRLPHENEHLEFAQRAVRALNEKYPGDETVFYLFQRKRTWNPVAGTWMGWERKRGKLEEFNRLLRGNTETSFIPVVGDLTVIQGTRFVITLDEDTQLPRDAAKRLIGTLAHPLNQAIMNEAHTRVIEGYGVLQPRVTIGVTSASRSLFASIYAGQTGVDPYPTAVSDIYQDLFQEGIYMGKGIYDVDTFITILDSTLPENSVLSHDLLEGTHVRAGMVTDIEMVDSYPAHYLASVSRIHRWVRGDWQLLPWLLTSPKNAAGERIANPLTLISRWKILDNLRRSLVAPATFVMLAAGMTVLPGGYGLWLGFALLALAFPIMIYVTDDLRTNWSIFMIGAFRRLFPHLGVMLRQLMLSITLLPHQAYVMLNAVVSTLTRLLTSQRQLLEWETAASAEQRLRKGVGDYIYSMWAAPVSAALIIVAVLAYHTASFEWLAPLLLLWLFSPVIAWLVSRPSVSRSITLSERDRQSLTDLARKTWQFFADMVGADDNDLPPDNYQEHVETASTHLEGIVAHRTSPTNMGMYLLSALAAYDLGFLSLRDMLDRICRTVDTMEKLPCVSGHWYNWYDTRTLAVLEPRYISTVDSGNLAGSLIALKQGILEILHMPETTLALVLGLAPDAPSLHDEVVHVRERCQTLSEWLTRRVDEMDFALLYNPKRNLFHIGYQVDNTKVDAAYYDLLASEARMASFVAIAKGDVPEKHWFLLGRKFIQVGNMRALLSWSGTMFEYLMPLLLMRNYPGCLLDETYVAVVKRQQAYGSELGLPWGVSESGFNARDIHMNYSYMAFGTPGLGVKRGLSSDYVVAPYATMLALAVDPGLAMRNIRKLIARGMENLYGLYEALDYTSERLPSGAKSVIIRSEMAHHQGMSLLSIANTLQRNIMQRRFHSEPMVRATELLLQERLPRYVVLTEDPQSDDVACRISSPIEAPITRRYTTPDTPEPEGHFLSNGHYSVLLTAAGGGYSSCDGTSVTRWRADPTRDSWGTYCYIRDLGNDQIWSAASKPLGKNRAEYVMQPEDYSVTFSADRVEFLRHDGDIETHMDVTVSPEHNAEVRRISLTNHGSQTRRLELTSYCEVALAPFMADLAHPAFSKLFVQTEKIPEKDALLCKRRPRTPDEVTPCLVHVFAFAGKTYGYVNYETSREGFIGRGRDAHDPAAMERHHQLSNTEGAVLDPILSIRRRIRIEPGETANVYFTTAMATDREQAMELVDFYEQTTNADHTFALAWTHSQIELRFLQMTAEKAHLAQRLASRLMYPSPRRRTQGNIIARNRRGQSGLWAEGISGDLPIMLVRISRDDEVELVRDALQAHAYLRFKGVGSDLVIVNEQRGGYLQPLRDRIRALFVESHDRDMENRPGGVFMKQREVLGDEEALTLSAAARVILSGGAGTMQRQLELQLLDYPLPKQLRASSGKRVYPEVALDQPEICFVNGLGGFTSDGHEYIITLAAGETTPAPWVNVLANPRFGSIVSESGAGYSWTDNSHDHRLSPWSNDPVSDPAGEAIYLRDEDTGQFWSPCLSPVRDDSPYQIRHGQGYTVFEHHSNGCWQELTVFVPVDCRAKIFRLKLRNDTARARSLSATGYLEWVLGTDRQFTAPYLVTDVDVETGIMTARNAYQDDTYASRIAFWDVVGEPHRTLTGDRTEFIGRNGSMSSPAALSRVSLSGRIGAGYDPCAASQIKFTLYPNVEKEILFVLGEGDDLPQVRELVHRFRQPGAAQEALEQVCHYWDDQLNTVQVETPDHSLDIQLNRWLLYQTISSRLWARSGFYQSGGAYGFRDQLQDVMALVYTDPNLTREQILRAAARQYEEGDVQHWWHPPLGAGIRSRCSDDYLWLPYVVADYVTTIGDTGILDVPTQYLTDLPLEAHEDDRYNIPAVAASSGTLYDHCIRSLDRGIKLLGEHSLPLIGSCDWNDGMSLVGREGKGESIWLGWFLTTVLPHFAEICLSRGDDHRSQLYHEASSKLATAIETSGWDGRWYRRAYMDDGKALGSALNEECQIDSIAQSWSAISGTAPLSRAREAMASLGEYLLRPEKQLVLLLTPPFDQSGLEPGYIKGYLPGVRENGGQYTHAAVWVALAAARLGQGDLAAMLLHWLNPINHTSNERDVSTYKVEPYVIAADVYSVEPHAGRGGWSWYTGSSAWMYRVSVEALLGLTLHGDVFTITPCIPVDWREYRMTYRYFSASYEIHVTNPHGVNTGVVTVTLDGEVVPDGQITRHDDGQVHQVTVEMGQVAPV
ncbi:MAG: GH36-type glycosyl hydrolase domain-containing protein [Armatimonadota bacterium]